VQTLKTQVESVDTIEKGEIKALKEEISAITNDITTLQSKATNQTQQLLEITKMAAEDYYSMKSDIQETHRQINILNEMLLRTKHENARLEQQLGLLNEKIRQETAFQQHNQQSLLYLRNLPNKFQQSL
jgi:predicted  nucleic acid-binding Zn-ribbon protein